MGADRKISNLSRLIPKNHFCSLDLFRADPLINWNYTTAVLFTAYDVYRSNNFWLDDTINSGLTLKEGLIELGFPKENTLVADTGVFEMEAKKAGIARSLGIDVNIEISNKQIFEAYILSGADYFVAPDEIILPKDKKSVIMQKQEKIKNNLVELLDIVPSSQIIAVIQGHEEEDITNLFDFYREHNISCFAVGGVIPLYHHSKEKLGRVLRFVRDLAKDFWLHIFGLPRMSLLHYYLHVIGVDSVDTSALLYLTARRRYLVGSKAMQIRTIDFSQCDCQGCINLDPARSTRTQDFFINLYIHNILAAVKLSQMKSQEEKKVKIDSVSKSSREKQLEQVHEPMQFETTEPVWMTAEESMKSRKKQKRKQNLS